jgi:Gluconate 2-dehydrogenase subunit 3
VSASIGEASIREGSIGEGSHRPRRRTVIAAVPVITATVLAAAACTSPARPTPKPEPAQRRFFTPHQAAVVTAATARIAPGPHDDPAEQGHPGAREADVTGYIDTMLGALAALGDDKTPPMIFADGPWSNRHTSGPDLMARFATLDPVAKIAWRKRLTAWQDQYRKGINNLDKLAGGDFTKATQDKQDKILATASVSNFTSLLFEHTIEGLYAAPEYGGNRGRSGWQEIGFPGDIQPRGYTAAEVERSDGHDPVENTRIIADVIKLLGVV